MKKIIFSLILISIVSVTACYAEGGKPLYTEEDNKAAIVQIKSNGRNAVKYLQDNKEEITNSVVTGFSIFMETLEEVEKKQRNR